MEENSVVRRKTTFATCEGFCHGGKNNMIKYLACNGEVDALVPFGPSGLVSLTSTSVPEPPPYQ